MNLNSHHMIWITAFKLVCDEFSHQEHNIMNFTVFTPCTDEFESNVYSEDSVLDECWQAEGMSAQAHCRDSNRAHTTPSADRHTSQQIQIHPLRRTRNSSGACVADYDRGHLRSAGCFLTRGSNARQHWA